MSYKYTMLLSLLLLVIAIKFGAVVPKCCHLNSNSPVNPLPTERRYLGFTGSVKLNLYGDFFIQAFGQSVKRGFNPLDVRSI